MIIYIINSKNITITQIIDFLHKIIAIIILSVPFQPIKYLKYSYLIPLILYTIWVVFDGCPITHATIDSDEPEFIHGILLKLGAPPTLNSRRSDQILNFYLVLSIYISFWRLGFLCRGRSK